MIERMGLDAFLAAEVALVKTRPIPMKLADSLGIDRERLTPHEVRILVLVAQGLTRAEIAEVLGRSPQTVKSHLSHIYRKLDVRNKAQALAVATERGYLG
jgi:DNA-binding NarL/FixJ family response regulator